MAGIQTGRVGRQLYRSLLKEIRAIPYTSDKIFLQEQLDSRRQGWKWFPGGQIRSHPTQFDVLEKLVPLSDSSCQALRAWKEHQSCEYTTGFRRIDLQSISRSIFKQKAGARPTSEDYDEALSALRAVMDQRERAECSSCSEDPERGLTVTAMSCYAPDDSDRRRSHLFTYRVTVQNNGPEPVRCVGRHWYIIGEDGELAGELPENLRLFSYDPPELMCGTCLEYHSGVDLAAAAGKMSGMMYFRDKKGNEFNVLVQPFALRAQ